MDRDIPIPPRRSQVSRRPGTLLNRVRAIPAGMSDFIPASEAPPSSVRGTVSLVRQERGCEYVTRALTENGVRGVRVWRKGEETENAG